MAIPVVGKPAGVEGGGGGRREVCEGSKGLVMGSESGTGRAEASSSPNWILQSAQPASADYDQVRQL